MTFVPLPPPTDEEILQLTIQIASRLIAIAQHRFEEAELSWPEADDDQLLVVCEKLPEDVAERLLALASGDFATPPAPLPTDHPVVDAPDTRRRFFLVEDAEGLAAALEAPMERWIAFRKDGFALSNKVAGVLAVGGARNGGQELTITSIQTALFGQEMIVVGESRPSSHFGPAVWNSSEFDEITDDEVGMSVVKNLGRRVAEVALLVSGNLAK